MLSHRKSPVTRAPPESYLALIYPDKALTTASQWPTPIIVNKFTLERKPSLRGAHRSTSMALACAAFGYSALQWCVFGIYDHSRSSRLLYRDRPAIDTKVPNCICSYLKP